MPLDTASAPAVVPIKPPRLAAVAASTSKPVPTSPMMPKSVVFGARKPRVYFAAMSKPPPTVTHRADATRKGVKAGAVVREQRASVRAERGVRRL